LERALRPESGGASRSWVDFNGIRLFSEMPAACISQREDAARTVPSATAKEAGAGSSSPF